MNHSCVSQRTIHRFLEIDMSVITVENLGLFNSWEFVLSNVSMKAIQLKLVPPPFWDESGSQLVTGVGEDDVI